MTATPARPAASTHQSSVGSLQVIRPGPGGAIELENLLGRDERARGEPGVGHDHLLLAAAGVDVLPEAAQVLESMLAHDPDIDLAYLDGCHWSASHGASAGASAVSSIGLEPQHRPGFSPERLEAQMYLGDVVLVRRAVLIELLTEREASDEPGTASVSGGLTLPLSLRDANALAGLSSVIAHVPRMLYRSLPPRVDPVIDLRPQLNHRPSVSVVIPTNGSTRKVRGQELCLVVQAIDSLVARTGYEDYEAVVVLTAGSPDDLADRIRHSIGVHGSARQPPLRFVRDDPPFNFSNASNLGAAASDGDVLLFLNDDTEIRTAEWMDHLVSYAVRADVGAVGARLLYENGTIQHAGIWSRGGFPSHRYVGFPPDHAGHLGALRVPQNCLAVSGACLAVERVKFTDAGGFCIDFPSSYNDVDLCLKLRELGYRTVVVPDAVLTHFEASTREPTITEAEQQLLNRRWRRLLMADPYDNPNHLAPEADEFPPPRAEVTLAREQAGLVTHHPRLWRAASPK